jgi:predicted PurR-regulated permease PerM
MLKDPEFQTFLAFAAVFLLGVHAGFLPLIFAGIVAFGSVRILSTKLISLGSGSERSNFIAVSAVAIVVTGILMLMGLGIAHVMRDGAGIATLAREMASVLDSAGSWAPDWLARLIPEKQEVLQAAGGWIRDHATAIGGVGVATLKTIGYLLLGLIIGAMAAVSSVVGHHHGGPVTARLFNEVIKLDSAFWSVVSAQIKISALNTTLTSIYLLIILPLLGIHLPLAKTLVIVTFVAGLIPVVGNLVSNTAIFLMSLTISAYTALGSLAFLVVIHKLEYFVNARFVGEKINARAFEILIVLTIGERLFGIAGVIAGPVFYAWLKQEWKRADAARPGTAGSGATPLE